MSKRRWTAVTLILPGLFWWLGAPTSGHAAERYGASLAQEVRSYSVDVGLVRLSVTARTTRGVLVHDLRQEEFQVFEEGVEQEVVRFGHHEAPISVVVLFDKSSSMQDEKLMHAKDAVVNFARAFRAQDEILVVAFSDGIDALGEDTASGATLDEAVEAVRKAGVPVYAIGIEVDADDPPMWGNRSWGRVGRDTDPPRGLGPPWRRLGQRRASQGTPGPSAAIRALSRLTEGMGGWTYRIVAAKRCKEICIRVAEELRNQYLLGYVPSAGPPDCGWRAVTVRTSRPGVTLATRQGYYATTP